MELAFAQLKKFLREGAAQTIDTLWRAWDSAFGEIREPECRGYFKRCGFRCK